MQVSRWESQKSERAKSVLWVWAGENPLGLGQPSCGRVRAGEKIFSINLNLDKKLLLEFEA